VTDLPELDPRYPAEDHEREQYFFDPPTLEHLATFAAGYERPCCVCAPMLGRALHARGIEAAVLDVDRRFADLPGFVEYDLARPVPVGASYGLILCDPPFFTVSLSALFRALRAIAGFDRSQPLLVSYLERREAALLRAFAPFGLAATGYAPAYLTVPGDDRNRIAFYGNLGAEAHARLAGRD